MLDWHEFIRVQSVFHPWLIPLQRFDRSGPGNFLKRPYQIDAPGEW